MKEPRLSPLILPKGTSGLVIYGRFTDRITPALLNLSEALLEDLGVKKAVRNRVAFTTVETFQNIVRHGQEHGRPSMFMLLADEDQQRVLAFNRMPSSEVASLEQRIDLVNSKSRDELKVMFLEELGSGDLSEKGGAGLGLIEMARRSGHPLLATFEDQGDNWCMFRIGIGFGVVDDLNSDLDHLTSLEQQCADEHVALLFQGKLTAAIRAPLQEIIAGCGSFGPEELDLVEQAVLLQLRTDGGLYQQTISLS